MRSILSLLGVCAVGSAMSAGLSMGMMGCTVAPSADGADAEVTSQTATAIVVVERTTGPGDTVHADSVVARFVRVRLGTVDDQALRIAGVVQDLPAVGTCSANAEASLAQKSRAVELLDVGPVSVADLQGHTTVLFPRTMPDPAGFVSGVFYSGRSNEAFAAGSNVEVHASGGADLADGFVISVPSPRELADVNVVSAPGGGLEITWDAGDPDAHDLVYVEMLSPSGDLVASCAAEDAGTMSIPASALGAVDEGQLTLHRLHHESFRVKGIDPGEVRFDLAHILPFRR
ncbi:MAG: hypothetical protein FWD69_03170 [Polyangiaceae bacterium]|nr:hypothetical protein [Polyangiaceae bacterium]